MYIQKEGVLMDLRCTNCQQPIDDTMAYCEACGSRITLPPPTSEATVETQNLDIDEIIAAASMPPTSVKTNEAIETIFPPASAPETTQIAETPSVPPKEEKKKQRKPLPIALVLSYTLITVLLVSIVGIFTLLWSALPSPQKTLDSINSAFEQQNHQTFYDAFIKPSPMIATPEHFFETFVDEWPLLSLQLQAAIDEEMEFAVLQNAAGEDIVEMNITSTYGLSNMSLRYLPVDITLIAPLQYETIVIGDTELFSIYAKEIFNIYAVPGTYDMTLSHKNRTATVPITLQAAGTYTADFPLGDEQ